MYVYIYQYDYINKYLFRKVYFKHYVLIRGIFRNQSDRFAK